MSTASIIPIHSKRHVHANLVVYRIRLKFNFTTKTQRHKAHKEYGISRLSFSVLSQCNRINIHK